VILQLDFRPLRTAQTIIPKIIYGFDPSKNGTLTRFSRLENRATLSMGLSDAVSKWVSIHGAGKRNGTLKFQKEICKILLSNWHDPQQDIDTITEEQIGEFAQKVAHYCPSRWNAVVSVLRSLTPKAHCLRYRKLRFRQFTPPNQLQFNSLLAECDRLPKSKAGLVIRFLALTGLRIREAKALTWANVFPDRIEVPAAIAKNGDTRCVPLLAGAVEVLNRLRTLQNDSERVLPAGNVRRGLEKACERAGLPKMSYHCFRHLFATRCIEAGVDLPTVARWMGHKDGGALLAKMYFHLLDEHSRSMAAKVRIGI
jgi:integrase